MTEDEFRAALEAGAESAVFFEPVYPPRHTVNPRSFFGGRPNLPPEIDWPVNEIQTQYLDGKSLPEPVASTFVGQIDLGELPGGADIAQLPRRGTLYFFFDSATMELDLPNEPGTGGNVIYSAKGGADCAERPEPKNLRPCYGEEADYHFKWLKHVHPEGHSFPKSFPKWAVKPFSCITYGSVPRPVITPGQQVDRKAINELHRKIQDEQFAAAFPAPVARNYFVWNNEPRGQWRGGPGFPYTWICIEIFAGFMLERIHEYRRRSEAEYARHRIGELEREVRAWLDRSHSQGRYNALPGFARTEFWKWFDGAVRTDNDHKSPRHWADLQRCLAEAYRIGPRLGLSHSADAAKTIPASYIDDQRWQLAVNLTGHGGGRIEHRLLGLGGEGRALDHILLMQFDSQEGLDWMWGDVGAIQYWIKPDDLAGLNFDNVIVSLRAH